MFKQLFVICLLISFVGLSFQKKGTHSRCEVLKCVQNYVDFNQDGLISTDEMDCAREAYLTWWEKMIDKEVESNEVILGKCDKDGDGFISEEDFYLTYDTCLHLQVKLELGNAIFCQVAAEKWNNYNLSPGDMYAAKKTHFPICGKRNADHLFDAVIDPNLVGPGAFKHYYSVDENGKVSRLDGMDCFAFDVSQEFIKNQNS